MMSRPSSVVPIFQVVIRGEAWSRAAKYRWMSLVYVSSPGVPTIRPRNLSGVGTFDDAGRWSTSSVLIRASCRYSLIFLVYS